MKRYYNFCDYTFCINSEFEGCIYSLRQHLPEIKQITSPPIQQESVCITFLPCLQEGVRVTQRQETGDGEGVKVEVRYHTSLTDRIISDLPHLSYCVMKGFLFSKGIYFLHSTLINQTLFVAPSGGGKSTLALHALEQRVKVYSFNKTAVKFNRQRELEFVAGTDLLSSRWELGVRDSEHLGLSFIKQNGDRFLYEPLVSGQFSDRCESAGRNEGGERVGIKKITFLGSLGARARDGAQVPQAVTREVKDAIHSLYNVFLDSACSDCVLAGGQSVYSPHYLLADKVALLENLKQLRAGVFFTNKITEQILKNG